MAKSQLRRAPWLAPLLLFVAACVPRFWALGWGLPYVEHPDEPALVEVVVRMVRTGDPNPHAFLYPSLAYYLFAIAARLHVWWGIWRGLYSSVADLPTKTYLFTTAPDLYLWLRAVTAFLGAATVPLLYILGLRMFGPRVALLAALALAVSRFHIEHSHYITTDVPTGLWVCLALLGAWSVARSGSWRAYLLAGVGVGLAAGTKYNAGAIGIAVAIATGMYVRTLLASQSYQVSNERTPSRLRAVASWCSKLFGHQHAGNAAQALLLAQSTRLIASGSVALLVFGLTTPYALLDPANFVRGLFFHTAEYAKGNYGNFQGRWNIAGYLAFLWSEGLMAPGCVLLLFGLPLLLRQRAQQTALLLAAILPQLLLLSSLASHFVRNLLPIFPPLFLLAAAATESLADWLAPQFARRAPYGRRLPLLLLAMAFIAPQLVGSAWLLGYWSRPHTLVAVAERLQALPHGMLAAVELNPVQWAGNPAVEPVNWLGSYPPDWYRARGYRYLVVNAERYAPEDQAAYLRLFAGTTIVMQLPDRDLGLQPGPGGALLDLGERVDLMPFVRRSARFGGQVELLGYELRPGEPRPRITPLEGADARELPSGQPVQINMYWRALAAMGTDYTLFVHVYDAAGQRVAQRDLPLRYENYPTSHWARGELVIDRADMPLPALPPGEYRIEIGLYDATTGAALSAENGAPVVLTTIRIP